MLAQPHGSFTPAWFSCSPTHCLRRFERSDCGCKGVSLCILRVVARKLPARFPARCWSLGCPGGDNLTWIASWRTRRMARRKRNVSDLPYTASPLSCGLSLSRFIRHFRLAAGKGVSRSLPGADVVNPISY